MEKLTKKRSIVKGRVTKFKDYIAILQQIEISKITSVQIKELDMKYQKMKSLLNDYDDIQTEIELLATDTEEQLGEREALEKQFYSVLSIAEDLLESYQEYTKPLKSEIKSLGSNDCSSHAHNPIKLPVIKLPSFDGNYLKWLEYRDTFDSLINSNETISSINKFHYLRASLEGSAAVVIKSIEFTSENYKIAWDILCQRYNNKNILINNHLKALFNLDTISKESFKALRFIIDYVSKNLRALNTLGQPTEQWDALIIFMVTAKLDVTTSRKWEEFKSTLTELPTLTEFYNFLRSRADILETAYCNRSEKVDRFSHKSLVASSSGEHARTYTCIICKQNHPVYLCDKFKEMKPEDRISEATKLRLCLNCLQGGHSSFQCKFKGSCRICRKKHNTLVHRNSPTEEDNSKSTNPTTVTLTAASVDQVLLCTALVKIVNNTNNKCYYAKALLDTGSQSSFMTESFKNKVGLLGIKTDILSVAGINNARCDISERCKVDIYSRVESFKIQINCLIVPKITGILPNAEVNVKALHLPNIELADPSFYYPSKIDILLGADVFWDIVCAEKIRLGENKPVLLSSKLGWLVSGPVSERGVNKKEVYCNFAEINNQLNKFWEIEELPPFISKDGSCSIEEKFCENHFVVNTRRLEDGRFSVSMPLKESPEKVLGNSYELAKKRLEGQEKRFKKFPQLKQKYKEFIDEYTALGHMNEIPRPEFGCYLPHHAVIREKSETTKLRVVFDASSATSSNKSLNEIQAVGPVLQSDLLSILLRFRENKFVITADIEKMYRQININPSQRHLQLILWRDDESQSIKVMQLNTVTYGTASAPFLATRCLYQLANECKDSLTSDVIKNDFYMDDMISGSNSKENLIKIYKGVKETLERGCFILRKYRTNCPTLFENEALLAESLELSKESSILGLNWLPKADRLLFSTYIEAPTKVTKRTVISVTCQIFDPLGLLCATIIKAKIMLQQLWTIKLDWDDPVPDDFTKTWTNFINDLSHLPEFNLPRHVLCDAPEVIELHCFVDASHAAYGACVYLRSIDKSKNIKVNLLCAKARVAPLKQMTTPRLELCGALLGARLCTKVTQALKCKIDQKTIWTDSTVVLGWINTQAKNLKTFVCNRINEINELTVDYLWKHISTDVNPADLASRGVDPLQLHESSLWWKGPAFLQNDQSTWPPQPYTLPLKLPDLKIYTHYTNINKDDTIIKFEKYSSYVKLKRVYAYVLRFINNSQKNKTKLSGPLNTEELQGSFNKLIKCSQTESFSDDIKKISNKKQLHKSSKLLPLNPFIDQNCILRVGGRIRNSDFDYSKKHPIILDSKHHLTKLIMKYEHARLFHAGPQLLLSSFRDTFWPIGGRNLARNTVKQCVVCTRLRGKTMQPMMSDLPVVRTVPNFPFYSSGVDFAGPFMISSKKGKGNRINKCYLCLFVCLTTKAVHLEVVSDLSTEAFILSLRRFIARRGKPGVIYCDNGKNFVGASNELGRMIESSREPVSDVCSQDNIKFMFNPAYAPNFGGIWEAGIKSAKFHLKRIAGNAALTFEELTTLFAQIESILNSRPLSPLSSDPNDTCPLTPGHFLIGRPLTSIPSEPITKLRPTRYELIEQLRHHFWERWQREYVAELQQRTKWRINQKELRIGDLVVIKEDKLPPLQWRLARVSHLYPGPDGVSRVADVLTSNGTIRRAINKMCLLPTTAEATDSVP